MIVLQGKFETQFLGHLSELEKAMSEHGLNPEDFIIAKSKAVRWDYNYTVTIHGQSFTVSMPNDVEFMKYFYGICFPPEGSVQVHSSEHKISEILRRMKEWFTDDPLEEKKD